MNKTLTVIIPVYKVEKYINKCLESLVISEDLMEKMEVIVVNDGTPDRSAIMAKEYEKKYPHSFKVIDKENGGHGSAWNRGVKEATGKYIRFLDSDDWLTNTEQFVSELEDIDVDLVFTNLSVYFEDSGQEKIFNYSRLNPNVIYDIETFDWDNSNSFINGYNFTNFHTCTYRTSMLKELYPLFLEKAFYDDEILFVMPLCKAKSFYYIDLILYNYLMGRPGQTVDTKILLRNIDFKINVRKQAIGFVKENCPESKKIRETLNYVLSSRCNNTISLLLQLPKNEFKTKVNLFSSFIKDNFNGYSPNYIFKVYSILGADITWILYKLFLPIYNKIR